MDNETLNAELLAFMSYLNGRGLAVCAFSKNISAYWPTAAEDSDLVAAYMNVKTGGKR